MISPLPEETISHLYFLIGSLPLSVSFDDGEQLYEFWIDDENCVAFSRRFIMDDNNRLNVLYTIVKNDEMLAQMDALAERRIFTPQEKVIIDLFDACSKKIIKQEMQLMQNRFILLTSEYTHN